MKKRMIALLMAAMLAAGTMVGCGSGSESSVGSEAQTTETAAETQSTEPETTVPETETKDEVVEIVFPVYLSVNEDGSDQTIEDYIQNLLDNNSEFLKAEPYKDDFCKISINESERRKTLEDMGDLREYLRQESLIGDDILFTDIKLEEQNNGYSLILYTTQEKYDNAGFDGLGQMLGIAMTVSIYRGLNLIDISEDIVTYQIIDSDTDAVLYDSEAEE